MKYFTTLLVLLLTINFSCKKDIEPSSATNYPDYYVYNGEIGNRNSLSIMTADSNLVICGFDNNGIFLMKITQVGHQLWRKNIASTQYSRAYSIVETQNHNLLLCGHTWNSAPPLYHDVVLIKTNSTGDLLWEKSFGGIGDQMGYNIIRASNNNFLIAATTTDTVDPEQDLYIIKVDENGDSLWTRTFPDPGRESPHYVLETQNGEFLITGSNSDPDASGYSQPTSFYFLKLDGNGNKLWDNKNASACYTELYSTIELPNGDLLSCGRNDCYQNSVLVKADPLGTVYWEKYIGESGYHELNSIIKSIDGKYIITGSGNNYTIVGNIRDILLFNVDQDGNLLWRNSFGTTRDEVGTNIFISSLGNYIIIGTSNPSLNYSTEPGIFLVKADKNGNQI